MTNPRPGTGLPSTTVRHATSDDHVVLGRLWLLFRHDMSAHTGVLPDPDGSYRSERLRAALGDPRWSAWLLLSGVHPIGFALARALDQPVHVLNSFFLVAPARRIGLGTAMARTVVTQPAGVWTVAYQNANTPAARFWPRLAARCDPDWSRERRPVPGRLDLPPDTWVTFRTGDSPETDVVHPPGNGTRFRGDVRHA